MHLLRRKSPPVLSYHWSTSGECGKSIPVALTG
jgi:hypothetical protein